jgi:hypothetical protein
VDEKNAGGGDEAVGGDEAFGGMKLLVWMSSMYLKQFRETFKE